MFKGAMRARAEAVLTATPDRTETMPDFNRFRED
jgi:hypothetical protein